MTEQETTTIAKGGLEWLDPEELSLDGNVRTDAALTKQFIASVRENGVLVPILAVRAVDGSVTVRAGQRRTLAAREAGVPFVPVWVIAADEFNDADEETIDRLITQITENDHRANLTPGERARGIQQLLDAGLSVTKTAKVLARAPQVIKDAKAAAGSQAALGALDSGQLTLAQAAVLAEFDDDAEAVAELTKAAQYNYFDHTASQLKSRRETNAARKEAGKAWAGKGFTVLDQRPSYNDPLYVAAHRLQTDDGQQVSDDLITDPSCWAVWLDEEPGYVDNSTGARVDENDIDWATEDESDAQPDDGLRHVNSVRETSEWVPSFYCIDVQKAGLTVYTNVGQGTMSEDAAQSNVASAAEEQKRERRKTLALNKLGTAANEVRREFVRKLLARKTPPKGAAIFVASRLVGGGHILTANHAAELAHGLLGASEGKGLLGLVDGLPPTGDGRAQVITLGLVCGAMEAHLPKEAWRSTYYSGSVKPYLEFLVSNGYELSSIENVVIGKAKADKVFDQHVKASKAETD